MAVSSLLEDKKFFVDQKKNQNISVKIEEYAKIEFIVNNKMIPCKHRYF